MNSLKDNPFAALFPTLKDAQEFSSKAQNIDTKKKVGSNSDASSQANGSLQADAVRHSALLESVFLCTADEGFEYSSESCRPASALFLQPEELWTDGLLTVATIDELVMRRMLLDTDEAPLQRLLRTRHATPDDTEAEQAAREMSRVTYLSQCFWRLKEVTSGETDLAELCTTAERALVGHACLLLQEVALSPYNREQPRLELAALLGHALVSPDGGPAVQFFLAVTLEVWRQRDVCPLLSVLRPLLERVRARLTSDLVLGDPELGPLLDVLDLFSQRQHLAEVLLEHSTLPTQASGRDYQLTLLGSLLAIGVLPKSEQALPTFFENPSRQRPQEHDATKEALYQFTSQLQERTHSLLFNVFRLSAQHKHRLLGWIGGFLAANKGRGQLWAQESPALMLSAYSSLGTLLSCSALLLRMCQPLVAAGKNTQFQAGYLQASGQDVHLRNLADETSMIPAERGTPVPEERFSTATELFFMCHYSLKISFHMAQERFTRINRELHHIQRAYQDAVAESPGGGEGVERLRTVMDKGMTQLLSYQTALSEPRLLSLCMEFYCCTSHWLCRLATQPATLPAPLTYPLPQDVQPQLTQVPEFFVTNIMDYILHVKRFQEEKFEACDPGQLHSLLDLVLVFMGSPARLNNPHLRAQMAEALEALLPPESGAGLTSGLLREELWRRHPGLDHVIEAVLEVFVSIETTGQSVEFEQKFAYRKPMYSVLRQLWTQRRHRAVIQRLCEEAVQHIEAAEPPLFLKFVNLLINDAIFLLDEALSFLTQIKEAQEARESGAWRELSPAQRQEKEQSLRQLGMMARYHNVMGRDTISTLQMLAKASELLLTHATMVERIAAMLNYFLLHLVGPKRRNLNVTNFEQEFEFKPKQVVALISRLYLDLSVEDSFCRAVAADGRSYSLELFPRTQAVLVKIGEPELAQKLAALAERVAELSSEQLAEDEFLEDAPEEFLDPIMGVLMKEPVILPTSGNTVDKQTIARHILSDQTDPFNRQPLSMEQVQPNIELRARVHAWLAEKRRGH